MSQKNTEAANPVQQAIACLSDSMTILENLLTLYFDKQECIDSNARETPEAKRFLDGYHYLAASVLSSFSMAGDARNILEGMLSERREKCVAASIEL